MEAYKLTEVDYEKQLVVTIKKFNTTALDLLTDYQKVEQLISTIETMAHTSKIYLMAKNYHQQSMMLKTMTEDLKKEIGITLNIANDGKILFGYYEDKKVGIESQVASYIERAHVANNITYLVLIAECQILKCVKDFLNSTIPVATEELKNSASDIEKEKATLLIQSLLSAGVQIDNLMNAMTQIKLQ